MSTTVYDLVTAKILESLAQGVVPWKKPWYQFVEAPKNAISNRPYRGINVLLLGLTPFKDPRWVTFRQAQSLGGVVKAGERATMVVFWKHWELPTEGEESTLKQQAIPLLRYYRVFNAEQVEGLKVPPLPPSPFDRENKRIERAEIMVREMLDGPTIREGGTSAWYRPADDLVSIPALCSFASSDAYYSTFLHELGHATGHEKRLNRKGVTGTIKFGSTDYSQEELVAELTSAFCCAELGLDNSLLDDAASYIHGWLSVFEGNPKMVVMAAAQAQRAADLIRGISEVASSGSINS